MSYFKTPNPAFPLRPRGMGDYVPTSNPAFPGPSAFVSTSCAGSCKTSKRCKKCRRKSLGDDDGDSIFPTGVMPIDSDSGTVVPSGYGYGPAQSGGVAIYPATDTGTGNYGYGPAQSGGVTTYPAGSSLATVSASGVASVPSISVAPSGIVAPTVSQVFGSALSGLSASTLLLGGGALLIIALVTQGKRR
jgi:hypothetical protein